MSLPADQIYRSWVVDPDYSIALEEIAQIADYGIGLYLEKSHSADHRLPREVPDESSVPIGPPQTGRMCRRGGRTGASAPEMPTRRPLSWEAGARL